MLYGVAVIVYFAVVFVLNYQADTVTQQVKQLTSLTPTHSATTRNCAFLQIVRNSNMLGWIAGMPSQTACGESTSITIDDLYFQRGKLELRGSVPSDQQIQHHRFQRQDARLQDRQRDAIHSKLVRRR